MHKKILSRVTATTLFAALAMPIGMAAQAKPADPLQYRHYQMVDPDTLGGKSAFAFVSRDSDILSSDTAARTGSGSVCSNCVIDLCLVRSDNRLSGYCLEGARGGICREDYDPTHCPQGAEPKSRVAKQCGPGSFVVDASRPCR